MIDMIQRFLRGEGQKSPTIAQNAIVVDVRSDAEYRTAHLEGARLVPLEKLETLWRDLPSDRQLVLYCRSGNRSNHARKLLLSKGFKHVINGGGLQDVEKLLLSAGFDVKWTKETQVEQKYERSSQAESLKILIPTDFSVQAEFARIMATKFTDKFQTEIHFLHIIEVPDTVTLDQSGHILTCGEIDKQHLEKQKQLAELKMQGLLKEISNAFGHVVFGKLTDKILTFSKDRQFDLIIMGTKGAWGMKERIAGSNTQQISRRSEVPVLSLMCDRSDLKIHDILYVHDFLQTEDVHPLLVRVLHAFGARYHQLHVLQENNAETEQSILRKMKQFSEQHRITDAQQHLLHAETVEQGVHQFLAEQDADILFIGTHGKGGIFHSSAAENLVKHMFKPIILFHLP
ncbi:MAG: universal stress protein [Saprospiraceae bacterium]|jgi:nucleotide-binding universal stress UspA family protein/rhodanese-related sulfurtransferase|nr:universal stress protein [Saprospiraceae bacterium]